MQRRQGTENSTLHGHSDASLWREEVLCPIERDRHGKSAVNCELTCTVALFDRKMARDAKQPDSVEKLHRPSRAATRPAGPTFLWREPSRFETRWIGAQP